MRVMKPYESRNAFKDYLTKYYKDKFKDKHNYPIGNFGRWLYENKRENFELCFQMWKQSGLVVDNMIKMEMEKKNDTNSRTKVD